MSEDEGRCPNCGGKLLFISKDYPSDKPLKEPYYSCGQCDWNSKEKKGFFASVAKLLHGEIEVPVDFHGVKVKARKLGGWEVICPSCNEHVTVTDNDVKNTGVNVLGKPVGPAGYTIVAHGLEYARDWNKAVASANNASSDYIDYRLKITQATRKQDTFPFPLSVTFSTELKLLCGHLIPITLGEDVEMAKEPDRVKVFLKLGISKKNYNWARYIFAGQDAPFNVGEKKAKELADFIQQLETEKNAINALSDKVIAETEKMAQLRSDFGHRVSEFVNAKRESEIRLLREAQLAELDRIDTVLARVAARPELAKSVSVATEVIKID